MAEEQYRRGPSRGTIARLVVVGVLASAVGIALGLLIDWFPPVASTQAGPIDTLWDVLIICSVPIFVGVVMVVLYSARAFRMRPGEEGLDGPPIHGNTRLEIVWTALPAIMLVSLCTYAYVVLRDIEKAPAKAANPEMHVAVLGQQFAWSYSYDIGGKKIATTRLYLPQGRSVKFDITGKDVIHDFWVPAFRMKIDAVPGVTTSYRVTPTRLGTYPVVCAELCGLGHAYMRSSVRVMPAADFDAWAAKQGAAGAGAGAGAGSASTGAQTAALDGKTLFIKGNGTSTGCGSCHQLADAGTPAGGIGPDLDKQLKGMPPAEIKKNIVDPNADIVKGYPEGVMPMDYAKTLKPAELDTLVSYLAKVTK